MEKQHQHDCEHKQHEYRMLHADVSDDGPEPLAVSDACQEPTTLRGFGASIHVCQQPARTCPFTS